MPNLPEDIVDRVKSLERQVRQLTTYINTRAAAPASTAGETATAEERAEGPGVAESGEGDAGDRGDRGGSGRGAGEAPG